MREIRPSGSMSGGVETEQGVARETPATERAGERIGRTYTTAPPFDSTARRRYTSFVADHRACAAAAAQRHYVIRLIAVDAAPRRPAR
jgi:hypothetical protein